jgi:hypothetical protein
MAMSRFDVETAEKLAIAELCFQREVIQPDSQKLKLANQLRSACAYIRKLEAKVKAKDLLIEGKEGLLVAYRFERQPTEKTWKLLEKAEIALAALDEDNKP